MKRAAQLPPPPKKNKNHNIQTINRKLGLAQQCKLPSNVFSHRQQKDKREAKENPTQTTQTLTG